MSTVNPYGRKPDQKSHLEGNVDEIVSRSSPHFRAECSLLLQQPMPELSPLVRQRVLKPATSAHTPSAVTCIPSHSPFPSSLTHPSQHHDDAHHHHRRLSPAPYLLRVLLAPTPTTSKIDPAEGTLSLRQCVLELWAHDRGMCMSIGGASISLPGVGVTRVSQA